MHGFDTLRTHSHSAAHHLTGWSNVPTILANGCEFYYELTGQGSDIVFIHGEIHGMDYWEYQLHSLLATTAASPITGAGTRARSFRITASR